MDQKHPKIFKAEGSPKYFLVCIISWNFVFADVFGGK